HARHHKTKDEREEQRIHGHAQKKRHNLAPYHAEISMQKSDKGGHNSKKFDWPQSHRGTEKRASRKRLATLLILSSVPPCLCGEFTYSRRLLPVRCRKRFSKLGSATWASVIVTFCSPANFIALAKSPSAWSA